MGIRKGYGSIVGMDGDTVSGKHTGSITSIQNHAEMNNPFYQSKAMMHEVTSPNFDSGK